MPSISATQITDDEVKQVFEYLKSLQACDYSLTANTQTPDPA